MKVFERDYYIRLLTQAGLLLGKIMGLCEQNKQLEALEQMDEFLGKELRLRSRLAMGLTDEDLLAMLTVTGAPNAESINVVAAFLQEEGELFSDLGQVEDSVPRFAKALRLNVYLLRHDMEIEGWDIRARINRLLEMLSSYELDTPTRRALLYWYETSGQLTDAEDLLYELQEDAGVNADEGNAFYARLSAYEDSSLEAAGLSREELEEGRRQWGALMKENV